MPVIYKLYEQTSILEKQPSNMFRYSISASVAGFKLSEVEVLSYVEKRFFEYYKFPIRLLSVIVNAKMYYDILSQITPDKPWIPVNISIDMVVTQSSGETNTEVRVPFMQLDMMGMCNKTKVSKDFLNKSTQEDGLDTSYVLRIALFDIADLNSTRSGIVAGNIRNKNIDQLIEYGFHRCEPNNKIRLAYAPSDNKANIPHLILRALGFKDYLKFLDDEYGIYTSRYNVWVENNVYYILNTEKSDPNMAKLYGGENDDKITINVYSQINKPTGFYNVEVKDNHLFYNLLQNDCIEDDLSVDNIMRPVNVTINSNGQIIGSNVSSNNLESISGDIKVTGGRQRTINKANRNPKFQATITIGDLPIYVQPYTLVEYIADNRLGKCMIKASSQIFEKGTLVSVLRIKSYDDFMEYGVEEKKTGKDLDRIK